MFGGRPPCPTPTPTPRAPTALGNNSDLISSCGSVGKDSATDVSAGNGWFWQQNIIQDRKSFITQSKLMIF